MPIILSNIREYLKGIRDIIKFTPVYKKYRQYTMVPEKEYIECLAIASRIENLEGCIVECGVWRGGMVAGFGEILGNDKAYFLFDSFEGLPPAKEIDGEAALAWQREVNSPGYFDNCKAEMKWAEDAMKKSSVTKYKLIKGWFENTVPLYKFDEKIALLHLDADWYDSTMICLEHLFPQVIKGGIVILDDYYLWEGCRKATHDYLSKYSVSVSILQYNNGNIHYFIKS